MLMYFSFKPYGTRIKLGGRSRQVLTLTHLYVALEVRPAFLQLRRRQRQELLGREGGQIGAPILLLQLQAKGKINAVCKKIKE